MEQLFKMILSLSISGTMVGGIIMLIRPVTKRYFSKRWIYYLWLLLLCRLLLPVHVSVNLVGELFTAVQSRQIVRNFNEASKGAVSVSDERNMPENYAEDSAVSKRAAKTEGGAPADNTADDAYTDYGADGDVAVHESRGESAGFRIVCVIWLIGVMVCALWKIYDYRRFAGNIYRHAVLVTNPEILAMREECRRRLGVRRRVPVYESSAVDSPIMIGFFRPYIIMPLDVPADLMLILHHELVHCRRRDIGYKWLFQLALCIHWFNPFMYLFNRRFCLDCELACDEAVMKSLTENGRKAYGDVLLDMAEQNISCRKNVMAMTLLEEKSALRERLEGIVRYRKRSTVTVICAVAAAVLLAGIALAGGVMTSGQDSAGSTDWKQQTLFNSPERTKQGLGRLLWSVLLGDGTDFMNQEVQISRDGTAYRMYDDDELIAGMDDHDVCRAWIYGGDERSAECDGLILDGSDTVSILYANSDTTIRVNSRFEMEDGRLKVVQIMPDQTVKILNESGEETVETVGLAKGRNVIKIVGQEARVRKLQVSCTDVTEAHFDGIYGTEEEERQHNIMKEIASGDVDRAQMRETLTGMEAEQVSELLKMLLDQDMALYAEDWNEIFTYSDQHLSAQYLAEALREGKADSFYGKGFDSVALHVSSGDWVEIVTSMQRLSYHRLRFGGLAGLNKSQCETCIMHFLDLGNTLTDSELRGLTDYVSAKGLERIRERNEEMKVLQGKS